MQLFGLVPLVVTAFYLAFYPVYKRLLNGKLSSSGFWKVWFVAPLLVILSFSYDLMFFLFSLLLSIVATYFILKNNFQMAAIVEALVASLETFLYLKG